MAARRAIQDFHGAGPARPFRRLSSDFTFKRGTSLVLANLGQILGTDAASENVEGELLWDDEKGSRLYLLHHDNIDDDLAFFAHVLVEEALQQEPRARLKGVRATRDPETRSVFLRVLVDIVAAPGSEVLLEGAELEIEVRQ